MQENYGLEPTGFKWLYFFCKILLFLMHWYLRQISSSLYSDYQALTDMFIIGELDDKTVELMTQPRCGVKDGPANYNTFEGEPKFKTMPVGYRWDIN